MRHFLRPDWLHGLSRTGRFGSLLAYWAQRLLGIPINPASGRPTGYIPVDLDDALRILKRDLNPAQRDAIRESPALCHRFIGMGIRNSWGLWRGYRLARWFRAKGVNHPDSMSGIILKAYSAQLNGKPFDLDEAIQCEIEGEKEIKEMHRQMELQGKAVAAKMSGAMMTLQISGQPEHIATLPQRKEWDGIRVRSMDPFCGGHLILGKERDNFTTFARIYFLNAEQSLIREVKVPGISRLEGSQVIGAHAFLSGSSNDEECVLIRSEGRSISRIDPPPGSGKLRLGRDGDQLLAFRANCIYRMEVGKWIKLADLEKPISEFVVSAIRHGDRIYVRDEGVHEDSKRLWWISLNGGEFTCFDKDCGLVSPMGPRWETVFSFEFDSQGGVWIAPNHSLVHWDRTKGYRVALINGDTTFDGELLKDCDEMGICVSAIRLMADGTGILAIGQTGIYHINDSQIRPTMEFRHTKQQVGMQMVPENRHTYNWHLDPTHVVPLSGDRYLLGGHRGAVYLLAKDRQGKYQFTALDEAFGSDIQIDGILRSNPD